MSDLKSEMKSKCNKLRTQEMAFYFYENVGMIMKESVLLLNLPGTVKSEAKVFSKKHKKTHTCRGRAFTENDSIVLEVEQGSMKTLQKALKLKPFKGTAIEQAVVRKGGELQEEEVRNGGLETIQVRAVILKNLLMPTKEDMGKQRLLWMR
jgi:hypothetical protein